MTDAEKLAILIRRAVVYRNALALVTHANDDWELEQAIQQCRDLLKKPAGQIEEEAHAAIRDLFGLASDTSEETQRLILNAACVLGYDLAEEI